MKKTLSLAFIFLLLIASFPTVSGSTETDAPPMKSVSVELQQDGGYIVNVIESESPRKAEGFQTRNSIHTTSGSKQATYYDANNRALWFISVSATFSYTGRTAIAVRSSYSSGYYIPGCRINSAYSYFSGASATAFTSISYMSITATKAVTLSCTKNGVLY